MPAASVKAPPAVTKITTPPIGIHIKGKGTAGDSVVVDIYKAVPATGVNGDNVYHNQKTLPAGGEEEVSVPLPAGTYNVEVKVGSEPTFTYTITIP